MGPWPAHADSSCAEGNGVGPLLAEAVAAKSSAAARTRAVVRGGFMGNRLVVGEARTAPKAAIAGVLGGAVPDDLLVALGAVVAVVEGEIEEQLARRGGIDAEGDPRNRRRDHVAFAIDVFDRDDLAARCGGGVIDDVDFARAACAQHDLAIAEEHGAGLVEFA